MTRLFIILSIVFTWLMLSGCSKDMHDKEEKHTTIKIAVILSDADRDRWDRIMTLAQKNISEATGIYPVFEFYEENSHDLMVLTHDLAHDNSIVSVIGCESETNTDILAHQMSRLRRKKPMFTFNTSQDIIRKYSTMGFMWGLCESDITQSEVILNLITQLFQSKTIALLASDGSYGSAFVDWFAFQAIELDLNPGQIYVYNESSEIKPYLEELSKLNCPILCVPENQEDAIEMILHSPYFTTFFSHKAFSDSINKKLKELTPDEFYSFSGATLIADPASGFQGIYEAKFNESPIFGEPQLYDAIMTTCLAYALSKKTGVSVNSAVATLLGEDSKGLGGWTKEGIERAYWEITEGGTIPGISGATGDLCFTPQKHTIIQYSTYALTHHIRYNLYYSDFINRNDGHNTSSINGAWEWDKIFMQDFDFTAEEPVNTPHTGNKAVIIAGSKEWQNYRHQADALAFYQHLKKKGFTDDDILLIIADDIAYNEQNPSPGKIIRTSRGDNVYKNVVVDYRLDDITPEDLKNILTGTDSENYPVVFDGTEEDNLVIFWSGHGKPGSLIWNEDESSFTGEFLNEMITEMHQKKKFRKLLGLIEACYAGSVTEDCTGIPGVMFMTAANSHETSKAEEYSSTWKTYLTNSFTSSILYSLNKKNTSIYELYQDAFKMTMGSHVTIYNADLFGNLKMNKTYSFFDNTLFKE